MRGDRQCTCPEGERPIFCSQKYALTACLRHENEGLEYAVKWFAAAFFEEQKQRAFIQSQYDKLNEWQTRHASECATVKDTA